MLNYEEKKIFIKDRKKKIILLEDFNNCDYMHYAMAAHSIKNCSPYFFILAKKSFNLSFSKKGKNIGFSKLRSK